MGEVILMIRDFFYDPNMVLTILLGCILFISLIRFSIGWYEIYKGFTCKAITIGNDQVIGNRQRQEDSFGTVVKDYGVLAIVADGIGSFVNGQHTSRLAVQTFMREFSRQDVTGNLTYFFKRVAGMINYDIRDYYDDIPAGTTIMAAVIKQNTLYYSWAGDSMIAIYRKGRLIPLNDKDNVEKKLEELFYQGQITREELSHCVYQERLLRYVGHDDFDKQSMHEQSFQLKKGDKVLLYTDGVETLSQIQLENILSMNRNPQETCNIIMTAINSRRVSNKDNATVILLSVNKEYK